MELKDTINGMISSDYKERFKAEYLQTKIRYEKLKNFCNKIEAYDMLTLPQRADCNWTPIHDCPLDLLRVQQKDMGMYLRDLELRAIIEKIDLTDIDLSKVDMGKISDGHHTFDQLYYQRMMLFAFIVNSNKGRCWKTRYHEDGEPCFGGGWFLVSIDTPEGTYGYHYEDKYWDIFECRELEKAKPWDGYTEKDITRLMSILKNEE